MLQPAAEMGTGWRAGSVLCVQKSAEGEWVMARAHGKVADCGLGGLGTRLTHGGASVLVCMISVCGIVSGGDSRSTPSPSPARHAAQQTPWQVRGRNARDGARRRRADVFIVN
jgi:hypothetical protein